MAYFNTDILQHYIRNNIGGFESKGSSAAKNPLSSATGLLQITAPTWAGLQQQFPQAGLTNIMDPEQQIKAVSLQAENELVPAFQKAGLQPTYSDVGLMNSFGTPTALKMRQADPALKVGDLLPSDAIKNNPSWFPKGSDTTVGEALNNNKNSFENGTGGLDGGPSDGAFGGMAPQVGTAPDFGDADTTAKPPPTPKTEAAESNSPLSRALTYLAAWGGGANGGDFAAGLGAGSSNGLKALQGLDAQQKQAQDENDNRAIADWQNAMKAQTVRNQTKLANAEVGEKAATAIAYGMTPDSAITLVTGRGGPVTFDPNMATRGTSMFETPVLMKKTMPDGSIHDVQVITNRRTGQPMVMDMTTGQSTTPDNLININDSTYKANQDQSVKDVEGFNNSLANAANADVSAQELQKLLPKVPAGPDMMSRLAREYLTATGMPIAGNEPQALQRAQQLVAQVRQQALQGLRGMGRLDLPEVKNAFDSVSNIQNSSPDTLYAVSKEVQNQNAYMRQMKAAWDKAPASDKLQGFANWKANYLNNPATQYIPSDFEGNIAAYNKLFGQPQPTAGQTPTSPLHRSSTGGTASPTPVTQGQSHGIKFEVIKQ